MPRLDEQACANAFSVAAGLPRRRATHQVLPAAPPAAPEDPAPADVAVRLPVAGPADRAAPDPIAVPVRRRVRRGLNAVGVAASLAGIGLTLAGVVVSSRPREVGAAIAVADAAPDVAPGAATPEEPRRVVASPPGRTRRLRAAPVITPASLAVPAVGIDTGLEWLRVNEQRQLDTPHDFGRAGWWATGPKAGADGRPAVFVGHVDSRRGPAVFHKLPAVTAGDEVVVADAAGRRLRFHVFAVERYPKAQFPTRRVYGNTAAPEVRLITCGGVFDASDGHYRDNIVVFARLRD